MNNYQSVIKHLEQDYKDRGHKFVAGVGTHLYGKTPHKGTLMPSSFDYSEYYE